VRSALSPFSSKVLLAILAGFLGLGSLPVAAAARYVEVWNPPEASMHKSKVKPRATQMAQVKKKRKSGPAVKQVADRTNIAPPALTPDSGHFGTCENSTERTRLNAAPAAADRAGWTRAARVSVPVSDQALGVLIERRLSTARVLKS
jgi:hypothetical protein